MFCALCRRASEPFIFAKGNPRALLLVTLLRMQEHRDLDRLVITPLDPEAVADVSRLSGHTNGDEVCMLERATLSSSFEHVE